MSKTISCAERKRPSRGGDHGDFVLAKDPTAEDRCGAVPPAPPPPGYFLEDRPDQITCHSEVGIKGPAGLYTENGKTSTSRDAGKSRLLQSCSLSLSSSLIFEPTSYHRLFVFLLFFFSHETRKFIGLCSA